MEREQFDASVQEALDALPEQFRSQMENVHIVIEDLPGPETLAKVGKKSKWTLLGLYEGVPKSKRGMWYGGYPVVPDRITLYRTNIERSVKRDEDIPGKIRDVLVHEIGHHFGMSERELREAGY